MSKGKNNFSLHIFGAVVLLIVGAAVVLLPVLLPDVFSNDFLNTVLKWVGIVALVFGALLLVVSLADLSKHKSEQRIAKQAEEQQQPLEQQQFLQQQQFQQQLAMQTESEQPQEDKKKRKQKPAKLKAYKSEKRSAKQPQQPIRAAAEIDGKTQDVTYIPYESVYKFVNMGNRQSTEEKFAEIAKMDKTQFVIYVARLFSLKGYQVKFTPVVENYNIDLLVEKMGVTIAVGCILTSKVLCDSDIRCVAEGSLHYSVKNKMALTNMYFDRSALDFAKRERMSLVDGNILAEDFMK